MGDRPPLIDVHLHLADPALGADLAGVLQRAGEAGIGRMVCNGTCEEDWPRVLELSERHRAVVPCFGLHPWFVSARSKAWRDTLEQYLDKVPSAVGEIGLDR